MADPLDPFRELANQQFPGKRKPANRPAPLTEPAPESVSHWDESPVVRLFGGQAREFFTIGHLAAALDRSVVTIRAWEKRGVLPQTPYRTPPPKGPERPSTGLGGTSSKGRRLWTRAQIEGVLQIAQECGVITDPKQRPPNEQFTARVTALFLDLMNKENQPDATT